VTATEAQLVTPPDAPALEEALLSLIDLVERRLDGDTDVVRALRRAVAGRHRPRDEDLLAARFQESRICLVRGPRIRLRAIEAEARSVTASVVDVRDDDVVLLVPGLPRHASASPTQHVHRVITRLHAVAPEASVGVSTPLDSLAQAARGLDEATRALSGCEAGKAVFADDVWFDIALSRMRESLRDSLAVGGPLSMLDDPLRSGADLRRTLVTWLEHGGDVRAAAHRLHLHPNTLRYRLRRAAEITGLDLEDPLQRLVAHVALTARTVA
jgi:sugar diacid utilization regulator